MGVSNLIFCTGILAIGQFGLDLPTPSLQTLAAVTLVFSGQAVFLVVRDRDHLWSSRPSVWLALSSILDVLIIATLAVRGILMTPLSLAVVGAVLVSTVLFAFALDRSKPPYLLIWT